MNPDDKLHIDEIELQRYQYFQAWLIPNNFGAYSREGAEYHNQFDIEAMAWKHVVTVPFLGQVLNSSVGTVHVPKTWVDHIIADSIKRWPWVRNWLAAVYEPHTFHFEVRALYPEANILIDKLGPPTIKYLVTKDWTAHYKDEDNYPPQEGDE